MISSDHALKEQKLAKLAERLNDFKKIDETLQRQILRADNANQDLEEAATKVRNSDPSSKWVFLRLTGNNINEFCFLSPGRNFQYRFRDMEMLLFTKIISGGLFFCSKLIVIP